jgi:predicted outer membrane lipoprotein
MDVNFAFAFGLGVVAIFAILAALFYAIYESKQK